MQTNAEKTFHSLKMINDFPFYSAKYFGDYRIKEFIDGSIQSPSDVVPFFELLFSKLGSPVKLSFPIPPNIDSGCSAFYYHFNNKSIIGKNLDWKKDPVLLLKTSPKDGYSALSMVNLSFCDFFGLNSIKYSILLSPYVPLDGMNEKGLVVSMLSVHKGSSYTNDLNKRSVGDFNIIRIILDTCSNVDEAITVFKKYNLMQTGALPLHYLIADKNISCIIEFFDGNINIRENKKLSYLTNFLTLNEAEYETHMETCSRYQLLRDYLTSKNSEMNDTEAKKLLAKTSVFTSAYQVPSTIWSLLFIPEELKLKIKIGKMEQYYSIQILDNKQ